MINLIKNIELNSTIADNHLRFIEYNIKNHVSTSAIEQLYEGALSICGLHPTEGPIIWNDYRRYLGQLDDESSSRIKKIRCLFYRQMSLPLSGLPDLLDEYRLWEEELLEESKDSLDLAKEYYIKGQYEWNLRKPFEMKVQTDNVSNLQELFDAWMLYINFEKDRMFSIEYSSEAEHHVKDFCNLCSSDSSYKEYTYNSKDSVIMAYRRALDDLGSLRIDLWFEFANFISTTTNCSHLLSIIYASSLQHFKTNHKLWILYLRTIVEVAKEKVSHFTMFGHFYTSKCRTHSSLAWYPQNEKLMDLKDQVDVLEFYLNSILTEFIKIKELFKDSKKDMIEMYTIVTDSIFNLTQCLKNEADFSDKKQTIHSELSKIEKFKKFEKNSFKIASNLYLEGEDFINQKFNEFNLDANSESQFPEDSVILFYSQWINFELNSSNEISTLISITKRIINNYDIKFMKLISLIFSVFKKKLNEQELKKLGAIIETHLNKKSNDVGESILREWKKSDDSIFFENLEKRKSELSNSNFPSPIVSCITSNFPENASIQESMQNTSPSILGMSNTPFLSNAPKLNLNSSKTKENNEGDFVCLSEIRLRRDKRRSRRNFTESDYETSSECSSESNSISAFIPNTNNKLIRNFTPPNTPNSMVQSFANSNAISNIQNYNLKSFSPVSINQQNMLNENSELNTPKQKQKSPGIICDLEIRTQCTWDGREATEPSIAPPIPPIPTLSSISSASSSSSQSSHSTKNSERTASQIQFNENFGIEKVCEDSIMPPPPYTPKKNKFDKATGITFLQPSASGDYDSNNIETNSNTFSGINNDNFSNKEENTLFLKFPKDADINENKIKNEFLKEYSVNVKEIRFVKDFKGNSKGFAYVDIEPKNKIKEIIEYFASSDILMKEKIHISISNPPLPTNSKKSNLSSSKFRKKLKKRQIDDKQNPGNTILVKNIDKNVDEDFIRRYFEDNLNVKIKNISISKDGNGYSRGFAFIEFFNSNDAFTAHMLNESKMGSSFVTISSSTRPLTFPKHQWLINPKDSINTRLTPRTKSKQRLPLEKTSQEQENFIIQASSLSNEDFRNFLMKD